MAPVVSPEVQLPGQDLVTHLRMAEMYALRRGMDPHTAKDVAQNVGLNLLKRGGVPVPEEGRFSPLAYVNTVTKNCMNDVYRRSARTPLVTEIEVEARLDTTSSAEDVVMHSELSAELETAITNIKPEHREVLLLLASGKSYEDIASIQGIALGTARSRISRARESVKQALDKQG